MRRPFGIAAMLVTATLLASATACGSDERAGAQPEDSAAATAGGAAPPAAAAGAAQGMGETHRDTLGPRAEAHLARFAGASPDSLRALLPANRDLVTALIAECEQMMRDMKMQPPQKWVTLVDELRRDVDRMPGMSDAQLRQAVPAHRKRVEDMLSMRRDMMRM